METKFSTKRIIAKFAALLCLMSMMPLTAGAQAQTVINETSSEELSKNSTIYVGEVVVNGVAVIKYLYSGDVTISNDLVNNVLDCLNGMADGDYAAVANLQGGDVGSGAEISLYVVCGDKVFTSDPVELSGWQQWQKARIENIPVKAGDSIKIGISVKAAAKGWGTIDDLEFYSMK